MIWVGRLEEPKDPELAVGPSPRWSGSEPDEPWTLEVVGSGTLRPALEAQIATLPPDVARRITLRGRLAPADVAEARSRSGVFLMTSHAGYEGFPRVLVEAMAAGLPAVVTEGADTGGLIQQGVSGFVCGRDPAELADAIRAARTSTAPRSPTPSPRSARRAWCARSSSRTRRPLRPPRRMGGPEIAGARRRAVHSCGCGRRR